MKNKCRNLLITLAIGLSVILTFLCALGSSSALVSGAPMPQPQQGISEVITRYLYLPVVTNNYVNLSVNPQDRQASLNFFNQVYRASEGAPVAWTGNHGTCNEGTTSQAFRHAMRLRINYFRAMAGVPGNVALSDEFNQKAQKAALMMSVNRQLSHNPPSTWQCYSADGAEAAGSSNLYLGIYSWNAIDGYIQDPGSGNYAVGHRRWILYPQTQFMGTGDIPSVDGYPAANALWVFDSNIFGPRPDTRQEFVAWPPPGYVPYQIVFPRWSFAYAGADFTSASVSMTSGGGTISVSQKPVVDGYGENTLVWEPDATFGTPPVLDEIYTVSINNVIIGGNPRDFVYDVIVFDPGSQGSTHLNCALDSHSRSNSTQELAPAPNL
jgi:uncharacterized protein YkwD